LSVAERNSGVRCEKYRTFLLPGDLLAEVGHWGEARPEFQRAATLTRNARRRA
jgi:predicted RNA polymerase sigma factor